MLNTYEKKKDKNSQPPKKINILDCEFSSLNEQKMLEVTRIVLSGLLESAALDSRLEARDALDVFEQYEWTPKTDVDVNKYNELMTKGSNGDLSITELDEFMGLVSEDGQYHLYYLIIKAKEILY